MANSAASRTGNSGTLPVVVVLVDVDEVVEIEDVDAVVEEVDVVEDVEEVVVVDDVEEVEEVDEVADVVEVVDVVEEVEDVVVVAQSSPTKTWLTCPALPMFVPAVYGAVGVIFRFVVVHVLLYVEVNRATADPSPEESVITVTVPDRSPPSWMV